MCDNIETPKLAVADIEKRINEHESIRLAEELRREEEVKHSQLIATLDFNGGYFGDEYELDQYGFGEDDFGFGEDNGVDTALDDPGPPMEIKKIIESQKRIEQKLKNVDIVVENLAKVMESFTIAARSMSVTTTKIFSIETRVNTILKKITSIELQLDNRADRSAASPFMIAKGASDK